MIGTQRFRPASPARFVLRALSTLPAFLPSASQAGRTHVGVRERLVKPGRIDYRRTDITSAASSLASPRDATPSAISALSGKKQQTGEISPLKQPLLVIEAGAMYSRSSAMDLFWFF